MVTEDIASTFEEIAHEQHNHKAEGEIEESPHSEKETGTEKRMFTLFLFCFLNLFIDWSIFVID